MSSTLLAAILLLGAIGVIASVVLYFVAKKFYVFEDPRIGEVEEALPAANCGGCGFAGCKAFAEACVKADTMEGLLCPVGGAEVMGHVSSILGRDSVSAEPQVAVVRCAGSCDKRAKINQYDGTRSCTIASLSYGGDTGCSYGCLGMGDCVVACAFDAIHINPTTELPEVDDDKCTACGACVKACPKFIIELRKKGPKSRRIFVSCVNKDKGAVAKKACSVGCIGCSKCQKVCAFDAITISQNLAYIDPTVCRLCRKCVPECPTNSIWELNFPPKVVKDAAEVTDNVSK